eukprot:4325453-Pleurochrysis_carterae.AAC.1
MKRRQPQRVDRSEGADEEQEHLQHPWRRLEVRERHRYAGRGLDRHATRAARYEAITLMIVPRTWDTYRVKGDYRTFQLSYFEENGAPVAHALRGSTSTSFL